ncbi:lactonase family protein [Breznakiella homolactica]|uniref:Lactonase family protein n=1 Tax=Breznakiella homolactica TaxID=2798577 RepID=A0A7T7XPK0_9SPIR|nr:lactonase family protein [Breznakiella homolactica]QQO10165.1 lactonase family protein [Breznakiella homolactica]
MKKTAGYLGAYTEDSYSGKAEGIYTFTFDTDTGEAGSFSLAARSVNPSYLCLHPSGNFLYAVNELGGPGSGEVSAYAVGPGAQELSFLNRVPSEGDDPCHCICTSAGDRLLAANYSSGSAAVFPVNAGGSLGKALQVLRFSGSGPNKKRQETPHAHSVFFDAEGRFAFVCDLGTDRIMAYSCVPGPRLTAAEVPWFSAAPGAGPRHAAFHGSGKFCYLFNELDSTIYVLGYEPSAGSFAKIQEISALPAGSAAESLGAAIAVSPDGRFLYASNRGHNSIAVFRIDPGAGTLSAVDWVASGGLFPRDFTLDSTGRFLLCCNRHSHNLTVFRINSGTGVPGMLKSYEVPSPVCVKLG